MAIAPVDIIQSDPVSTLSGEGWPINLPEQTEWVNGQFVKQEGMTLKHSRLQFKLGKLWEAHALAIEQDGLVYTAVSCQTIGRQVRIPDVAYLTPDLIQQYGQLDVLPQSFPLVAEVVSPTDLAEAVIAKAQEYLQSGAEEVWLLYPNVLWVIVVTQDDRQIFTTGETVTTQRVLPGFAIAVDQLFTD